MCCFCGGLVPADTVDHVPLRAAFTGNVGPEGFEFPACSGCNSGSADSEQVFALYARLSDQTDRNDDKTHNDNLIRGVRNNYPELLPNPHLPANQKRRALRHFGWLKPDGMLLDDVNLVGVPAKVGDHIEMVAIKLLAALHYKHLGRALDDQHAVFGAWSQQGLPGVDEAQDVLFSSMPQLVIGARVNTNIGDQFAYRWGQNVKESLFGYAAGFGTGLFLFAASAPLSTVQDKGDWVRYSPPQSPRPND